MRRQMGRKAPTRAGTVPAGNPDQVPGMSRRPDQGRHKVASPAGALAADAGRGVCRVLRRAGPGDRLVGRPALTPARSRIEETVLDLTDLATTAEAGHVVRIVRSP